MNYTSLAIKQAKLLFTLSLNCYEPLICSMRSQTLWKASKLENNKNTLEGKKVHFSVISERVLIMENN